MPANPEIPSRADADRAAALLVSAGVSRVLLFGSVARDEATEDSDVDLVAIYDDVDYSERFAHERELSRLVEAEIGHPVDVLVTDRPEWKVRSENVVTSLESRAVGYGVALADQGVGEVDWDKEMVLPTNSYEEALRSLREVSKALTALGMFLTPSDAERQARELGDYEESAYLQGLRFEGACGQAQRAVESAIKSLLHLASHQRGLRARDIAKLATTLVQLYSDDVAILSSREGQRPSHACRRIPTPRRVNPRLAALKSCWRPPEPRAWSRKARLSSSTILSQKPSTSVTPSSRWNERWTVTP